MDFLEFFYEDLLDIVLIPLDSIKNKTVWFIVQIVTIILFTVIFMGLGFLFLSVYGIVINNFGITNGIIRIIFGILAGILVFVSFYLILRFSKRLIKVFVK